MKYLQRKTIKTVDSDLSMTLNKMYDHQVGMPVDTVVFMDVWRALSICLKFQIYDRLHDEVYTR